MPIEIDPVKWSKALRETLTSRSLWAYVLLTVIINLAMPSIVTDFLGITMLRDQLRPWLGAAALLSGVGLAVAQGQRISAWLALRKKTGGLIRRLNNLSPEEKALLKKYIDAETKTQYFDLQDGVAAGLKAVGILYRPTDMGDLEVGFAFNIQPWAWDHLRSNPQLLEGARAAASHPTANQG